MSLGKTVSERQEELVKTLKKKLSAFLDKPDEENLHDLRTAIRRTEASTRTLPKGFRKDAEVRKLRSRLTKLLKRSAKVRDCDTVVARLSQYQGDSVAEELVGGAKTLRKERLRSTLRVAAKVKRLSALSPDDDRLDESKVRERIGEIEKGLGARINKTLPLVLADPQGKEELHSLRKDCKKLRYTMELSLQRPEESKVVKTLTSWQDLLGEVRDADVTIEYLKKAGRSRDLDRLLAQERGKRAREYEKFVALFGEAPGAKIPA